MKWLIDWLAKEAKNGQTIILVLAVLAINILYNIMAFYLLSEVLHIPVPIRQDGFEAILFSPLLIFIFALNEELIFRAPLGIAAFYLDRLGRLPLVLVLALISSIIFGWLHGGWIFVCFQGVGGYLYSLLFLKCGGLKGYIFKPLVASTFAHYLHNQIIVLIVLYCR